MLRIVIYIFVIALSVSFGWMANQYFSGVENQQMVLRHWLNLKGQVLSLVSQEPSAVEPNGGNHQNSSKMAESTAENPQAKAGESALEHAQKHLDPTYVCPMHPQIVRDEPGSCPICGMDLVAVEAETDDNMAMSDMAVSDMAMSGMNQSTMETPAKPGSFNPMLSESAMEHAQKHLDPTYVCPMHPQIVRDEPGSCPICGMDLVAVEAETDDNMAMSGMNQSTMETPAKPSSFNPMLSESAMEHAQKHLDPTYVCPMHPQIVRDEPGSCPICGMDLVAVEAEPPAMNMDSSMTASTDSKTMTMGAAKKPTARSIVVKIDPAVVNNLGVQVESVKKGDLYRELDTVAYVDYDEDKLSHVHQLSDGWIEKLYVKAIGDRVKKGDLLYAVYSPELLNAQEDYLLSLKNKFKGVEKASRERLYSLGFTNAQIKRLKKTRRIERTLKTYAKHSGIVVQMNVREGMYIKPQTEVMTLADLNYIWFIAEVYEKQSAWVQLGQDIRITMDAYPGKEWYGEVDYIYPELDKQTRTLKVRIRMPNQHGLFKLNMYAKVRIYTQKTEQAVYVPLQAIIQSGNETRVIIQQDSGRFSPREVVVGMESDDRVEIKSGLKEGEQVVISGQFLIDSEASLKASLLRFRNKG